MQKDLINLLNNPDKYNFMTVHDTYKVKALHTKVLANQKEDEEDMPEAKM